jgi:hypothetical protein
LPLFANTGFIIDERREPVAESAVRRGDNSASSLAVFPPWIYLWPPVAE